MWLGITHKKMPKYKNISEQDLELPGVGVVKAGGVITQPEGFNNANFEKVGEVKTPKIEEKIKTKGK
jgi:hypothetical protein